MKISGRDISGSSVLEYMFEDCDVMFEDTGPKALSGGRGPKKNDDMFTHWGHGAQGNVLMVGLNDC